jgi:hypothetical protein
MEREIKVGDFVFVHHRAPFFGIVEDLWKSRRGNLGAVVKITHDAKLRHYRGHRRWYDLNSITRVDEDFTSELLMIARATKVAHETQST